MKQDVKNYNSVARFIHWLSAVVIIAMFAVGLWMVDLNYYSSWYQTAPFWHKSVGITLAALTIFRVVWKMVTATPSIEGKPYEIKAAKAVHHFLYLLLAILFLSGYLISTSDGRGIEVFSLFTLPGLGELFPNQSDLAGQVHYYSAFILIGFAGLHAAAAIKHHLIDKDNTLRKMTGAIK